MTDRTDDLFDLIKAMTKSEKRYFRLFASLHSRTKVNKYVRLFELIDAHGVYDEREIKREFAETFTERHFAETKHYLYQAILRGLHAYGAEKSRTTMLAMMLDQARILYRKKLYDQCRKVLKKTREEAVANEYWSVAVDALQVEHQILMKEGADAMPRIGQLLNETEELRRAWSGTVAQWSGYIRMLTLNHLIGYPRSPEDMALYRNAIQEMPDWEEGEEITPSAEIYRRYSIAIYREAMHDYRGALETYKGLLPIIELSGRYRKPDHLALTPALHCICLLSIKARDAATFLEYHPILLRTACRNPKSPEFEGYIRAMILPIDLYMMMGSFERALEEASELEGAMRSFQGRLPINVEAHAALAIFTANFGLGRHSPAVDSLNKVLGMKNRGLPAYRYALARILQIILHFERGDHDLVESLLRSLHRYFAAADFAYRHEEAIFAFIRRALRSRPGDDRRLLFRSLLEEIRPLQEDPYERSFIEQFDLISWLESKISDRPLSEILRGRFAEPEGESRQSSV